MKRLLTFFLILALLLPMGIVAQAEEVEIRPFCLTNWTKFENEYTNVYYMPFFWSNNKLIKEGKANVSCPALGGSTIPVLAENLKKHFDTVPEGGRFINFCMVHDAVFANIEDACFMDKAVPLVSGWIDEFFAEYKRIGGKIDGLFTVVEYMPVYSSYIHDEFFVKDPTIYNKIVNNPTYIEKIRPQLVDRGFQFYPNPNEVTPEIYSIYPKSGEQYAQSRAIWDAVMRSYLGQTVYDCCAPLWKYYPDAVVSDYQSKDIKPWVKETSDKGGALGSGGIQTGGGNSSNDNFSFNRPNNTFFANTNKTPAYKNIAAYNNTIFADTEFNRFLFDANIAKSMYLSSDTGNLTYWTVPVFWGENVYYSETLIHMGMVNPKAYHGYILQQDCGNSPEKYEQALKVVDDSLRELTRLVGAADRKPIAVDPSWNHAFVLSGMNAGGKNVWRITPDISKTTHEAFKVDGSDPTFYLDGETVTFPGGKIIEDSPIELVGSCGYWIETEQDVMPVITRDENYFVKNPAFQETYESYEQGMDYTYNNALPVTCWEPKKTGSSTAVVQADPANADNQVLAVKGTYSFKNTKILKNVTAGDTYAENQAWEISFALPADLAEDAELILLNATGNKKKAKDGGFKIAGGKVYYSQGEEYVEMNDVTLSPDTRYTVVRDMEFNDKEAVTCDYYVYDAERKLLGKAMDIPVDPVDLPLSSISFSCANVAGDAVLFDDYKLYPTAVATDFYLYDAGNGMAVDDQETARAGDTAFRLSWLNGTETEKSYSVVAAYYDGDKLVSEQVVSEVKMSPNADGVAIGVVKNENEGKTMRVYLRDNNPAETGKNRGSDGDGLLIVIIAAAAAVIVLAVVIIVVVVTAKKKKPAAPTTETGNTREITEKEKSDESEETTNE